MRSLSDQSPPLSDRPTLLPFLSDETLATAAQKASSQPHLAKVDSAGSLQRQVALGTSRTSGGGLVRCLKIFEKPICRRSKALRGCPVGTQRLLSSQSLWHSVTPASADSDAA